jgi:hypothetical protein
MQSILRTIALSVFALMPVQLISGHGVSGNALNSCAKTSPIHFHELQSLYFNTRLEDGVSFDTQESYASWPLGFSPIDESFLLTSHNRYDGQRDEVRLWDWRSTTSTALFSQTFTEYVLSGISGIWSPTGQQIALLHDGMLTILNLEEQTSFDLEGYVFGNSNVLWSPDGTRFAAPVGTDTLIWDAQTGEEIGVAEAPGDAYQVVWTENNDFSWLIKEQVDDDRTRFSVWTQHSNAPIFAIEGVEPYALLSPNAHFVATFGDHITISSVNSHQQTQMIPVHEWREAWWTHDDCFLMYTEMTRETHPYFSSAVPAYWLEIWSVADAMQVASLRESGEIRNVVAAFSLNVIAYSLNDNIIRIHGQQSSQIQ